MPVLERMAEIGLPLCVHGEVTDPESTSSTARPSSSSACSRRCARLPELRIVLEHVTTAQGVDFVRAGGAQPRRRR